MKTPHDKPIKVVLIHDWLTGMRGGEKVLELICQLYPDAPLYTLLFLPGTVTSTITNRKVYTSLLQFLPLADKKYRNYLPLYPLFAETHKVRDADLVLSTSHAVAKSMLRRRRKEKRPLHICYIHTPMRYAWDRFDDYFGPDRVGWIASRLFFRPLAWYLRAYDRWTLHRVDQFVANSTFVAEMVKRHYNREAIVLPPPVNIKRFSEVRRFPEDWYLVVSALVPYKKVDHAIRASAALRRNLIIVGKGPEKENLVRLAQDIAAPVKFAGDVSDTELMQYYGRAKALLFPGVEDFGIVPLEAAAAGCPVIALAHGGVLDSMTSSTAVLYKEAGHVGLQQAIQEFEQNAQRFDEHCLRIHARAFSEENFVARFNQIVERALRTIDSTDVQ
jgi:glycosyltransferase involved in cell wall biosynthesis